ncbi:MAG: type VI secretion system tip protein TssI/VgrG [Polyangiales bacterium]
MPSAAVAQGVTTAARVGEVAASARTLAAGGDALGAATGLVSSGLGAAALVPGAPAGVFHAITGGVDAAQSLMGSFRNVFPDAPAAPGALGVPGGAAPLSEVTFRFEGASGQWRVVKFRAQEALSETWEAAVDLAGDDLHDDPDALLGRPATAVVQRATVTRYFRGVVRRVEHLGTANGRLLARAWVVPALWALSQRVNSRIFHDVKVEDVVRAVLRDAGLYDGSLDVALRDTYLRREYCVQYRESDLAFLQRLMEEEGVTYFFRHAEGTETLVVTDHDCYQPVATLDGQAVPVAGTEAGVLATESVRQLDWGREQRPTAVIVRDFDFTRPQLPITQQVPRDAGARPVYEYPAEAVFSDYRAGSEQHHDDNVQRLAEIRLQALRASEQQGTGPSNVTGMTPGFAFTLRAHGRAALNQRHVVTRVVHEGNARDALDHETQHTGPSVDRYRNTITCIPASVPWRPMRTTPRPVVTGIQTATVVGPAGREIFTDPHGRIKVRFHWDRRDEARDPTTLRWVRVAQAWGGGNWGMVVTPRIGMEVVVQFLEGNPDRPLVMGCVYNNSNRPAVDHPHASSQTRLRSNSTPGGNGFNEFSFEDAAGSERVYLHAQRDHAEDVLHDQRIEVGNDRTVTVKGEETNSVIGGRTTRIGGGEHNAVSPDSLTVTGNLEVRVRGQEALQEASHVWHIKANDQVLIECPPSKIDMTRGRIVITTGASTVELSGGTINIHSNDLIDIKSKLVKINS